MVTADQHRQEAELNRSRWNEKPLLQRVYADFYRLIRSRLSNLVDGKTVEIGSGIGAIKEMIPECHCTDRFEAEHLDGIEDIYRLSFGDEQLANVILFDVFHHLEFPGDALKELYRVLLGGGRVVLIEPTLSCLGWIVYGGLHREPVSYSHPIQWHADGMGDTSRYYAAQGNAYRIFVRGEFRDSLAEWDLVESKQLAALSYVGSGGFAGPQLYPTSLYPLMKLLDRPLGWLPKLFATRLLVVLQKPARPEVAQNSLDAQSRLN